MVMASPFQSLSLRIWSSWALALLISSTSYGWWNSEWTLRKQIVLDLTDPANGLGETGGAVPVLIRLHEGNFSFGQAKPDGSDLRFIAADDKTLLPYHIEKIDTVLNEAFVWVKLPELKAGVKTSFWLYYGNAGNKATKVEDTKGTYDPDTVAVYHFSERNQPAYDFTVNGNNAQNSGTAVEGAMIGTGLRLDGKNAIAIPASPTLAWADRASVTWSAWIKSGSFQPNAVLFARREAGRSVVIGLDGGTPYVEITTASGSVRSQPGTALPVNAWKHLAVVAAPPRLTLYVDGESYATINASIPALNSGAMLGESFAGEVDEMVVSKTDRPAGNLKFAALSQGGDRSGKVLTIGSDEQETNWLSAFKGGYVGVIIGSLTVDGWVVIGLLGVMSLVSWIVMIKKATYLNRISKGNASFLKEWSHVASDLSALEVAENARTMGGRVDAKAHRAMRDSSLYQIYHVGVEEIRHRVAPDQGTARILSARSIHAIRATLDGSLVRENQKLNAAMVLLTIAISGGPFLGLLGTVVGVMITFAAVAQAGDVNVNAIAPGIAAALAATVAGLAVAIPALFGYNYLLTRIKAASGDMHVFIDEFVTKLAEFYSEPAISE